MFLLDHIAPVPYSDPWELPLQTRIRTLSTGRVRIAYFYERADNSTFRYRIYNMAQVLNDDTCDVSASYFFLADMERLDEIANLADLLVICRTRFDHRVIRLVDAFKRRGKRVIYDIDDFVFDIDYVQLVVKTLDLNMNDPQVWHDWFSYNGRLGATLRLCDAAIATTAPLAARIAHFAQIPVAVIPNYMNREQLALSDRVFDAKRSQKPGASGLIHFGYFSGSPSHNKDFAMVIQALEVLLAANPHLGVVVVGYIEAGPVLEKFGSRVQRFPFHDYVNLQKLIGSVEFNLMPLQHNAFTNCKSELKYFEAAAVGTVSVASPSDTYARAIDHGTTGYLARAHEWLSILEHALERIDDYATLATRARADAMSKFSWTVQRSQILAALGLN